MEELDESHGTVGAAQVTFDEQGAPVIELRGEIDMSNVDSLRTAIEPAVARTPERVVFDLGTLEFMDSSGIALLLQIASKAQSVELRNPSALVRRMIEATGLADVLHMEA